MEMTIQMDAEWKKEFKSMINEAITKALNENIPKTKGKNNTNDSDDQILTRKEVMKMLHVSHSTLYHYQRKEIIPFLKIGNRVYFKKRDILNNIHLEGDSSNYKTNLEDDEDDWD